MITTTLSVANLDVRQMSNSMRTMITDANTQSMLPAGNSNSLILTGFAPQVAALTAAIQDMDAAATPDPSTAGLQMERVVLEHASAAVTAEQVLQLVNLPQAVQQPQQGQMAQATRLVVVPDDRTNALLMHGTPAQIASAKEAVALIDVPGKAK